MVAPTYPGVYMQEKSSGPGAITGVSTSTMGLVGWTPRGRVDYPVLCTSFVDYASKFGGFTGDGLAPTEAYAFFANGGQRLYMVRAAHSDAVASSVYWSKAVTSEVLTSTATGTGLYILTTAKVPIVAVATVSGVTVTFENAGAPASVNVFRDAGAGVLTHVAGTGTGGTGSIDYTTGEVNIQLTDPTEYVGGGGGANDVTITYSYKVATFTMAWPGVEGNDFRIRIQGSPNYYTQSTASYSAYKILVEENVAAVGAAASWQTDETFDEVVLDDATDPKYFKAIMNDAYKGSQLVTVTDYGNAQHLAALNGVAVTDEDFSATIAPAYDGTTKAFTYATANTVAPGTLEASFKFIETDYRIGTGDGTATPTCLSLGKPIDAGGGAVLTAKVTVNLTLTVGGATVLYDDGAGNLKTSPFPGTTHGTITYTTGAVTLNVSGTTTVAGTPITISAVYKDSVIVEDDANGVLSIKTPAVGTAPPAYTLNSAGTNTVDYDTKVMALTWQIAGRPADGPKGVYATLGETVDYYTQPSDEVIYTMSSGADGTATTRADVTAAALSIDARGMYALGKADEIMQVVIADFQTDDAVCRDVITYCENMGDKFGLFTVPEGMDEQEAVNWRKFTLAKFKASLIFR
jgi:hypothetical protein